MRTQHQLVILIVLLFAFSVSGTQNWFNLRSKKSPPQQPAVIPNVQAVELTDQALLTAEICVEYTDIKVDADCRTYEKDCRDCWQEPYLSKCVKHCGAGNNCTCVPGSDCEKSKTKCENCEKKWKRCQCPSGMELQIQNGWEYKCVLEKCPKGTWRPQGSKCTSCNKCPDECQECTDMSHCQKCKTDYCLYKDRCVPKNTTCDSGYKVILSDGCFECKDKCPDGSYPDEKNVCGPCVKPKFVHNNECIKDCPDGSYKYEDLNGNIVCVRACPKKYWENTAQKKCDRCKADCEDCENGEECTDCKSPRFLVKPDCLNECKNGTYKHKNAHGGWDCVKNCPEGQWENTVTKACEPCDGNCKTCEGAKDKCTSCKDHPHILFQEKCHSKCPKPFYEQEADGKHDCVRDCSNTQYENDQDRKCHPCDKNCKTCDGTASHCITCPPGKILHNNECIDNCPTGYVVKGSDNVAGCQAGEKDCTCRLCPQNCQECINDDSDILQCSRCKEGFYDMQGRCVSECDKGYYKDTKAMVCECCNARCANCEGPGVSSCSSCISPYVLRGKSCVSVKKQNNTTPVKPNPAKNTTNNTTPAKNTTNNTQPTQPAKTPITFEVCGSATYGSDILFSCAAACSSKLLNYKTGVISKEGADGVQALLGYFTQKLCPTIGKTLTSACQITDMTGDNLTKDVLSNCVGQNSCKIPCKKTLSANANLEATLQCPANNLPSVSASCEVKMPCKCHD